MSGVRESKCPTCRHQYYHFPTVCQLLHFLLLKLYPVAYNRRTNQTLEEEKKSGYYSPQFDFDTCESQAKFGHSCSPSSSSTINLVSNSSNVGTSECMDQPGSTSHEGEPEITGTRVEEKALPLDNLTQQKISVADVMCTMCKQLLFHPVVLHCGHVYCETCVYKLADEMLRCQVCQIPHPRGFPKVCLEFDHFLEEQFPEEYAQRTDAIELKDVKLKPKTSSSCLLDNGNQGENMEWLSDPDSKAHFGVGCDFCGVLPIIGNRYKCNDCKEKIGFDLCGDCYDSRSKLPGRFNQQHTSDHSFKLVEPDPRRNIMLRLITGQLGDRSFNIQSLGNIEFTAEALGLFDGGVDNQNEPDATD